MPTKLRPSGKRWIKDPTTGRSTNKWVDEHYYIKGISQKELFEELNKHNAKPKVKAKIRKELVRRGITIVKKPIIMEET
jgi:hypothetical protein|tara:strand:+ start:1678 stop:1914 length:237 start_codon:yes stop_codon:yes gene_type:complete